jgi:hypothetical protein
MPYTSCLTLHAFLHAFRRSLFVPFLAEQVEKLTVLRILAVRGKDFALLLQNLPGRTDAQIRK